LRVVAKVALGLGVVASCLVVGLDLGYYQPRQRAREAEARALDAEIARYKALLPELERVTARRDALRQELLFLEEFDRQREARLRGLQGGKPR
jgi:Tfp pilus assembly protein PilN